MEKVKKIDKKKQSTTSFSRVCAIFHHADDGFFRQLA
jgi:hypothetical protein